MLLLTRPGFETCFHILHVAHLMTRGSIFKTVNQAGKGRVCGVENRISIQIDMVLIPRLSLTGLLPWEMLNLQRLSFLICKWGSWCLPHRVAGMR